MTGVRLRFCNLKAKFDLCFAGAICSSQAALGIFERAIILAGEPIICGVERWAVWPPQPGASESNEHHERAASDEAPDVSFLPPMARRRLSRLSKMALYGARCTIQHGDEPTTSVPTVFSSRFGEMQTTYNLLSSLADGEGLSPAGFSTSVHNTSSGLRAIHAKDTSASIAVASGPSSLEYGFIEAAQYLRQKATDQVLLLHHDDDLPDIYGDYSDRLDGPIALSILLSNNDACPKLSLNWQVDKSDKIDRSANRNASDVFSLLAGDTNRHVSHDGRLTWTWDYDEAA